MRASLPPTESEVPVTALRCLVDFATDHGAIIVAAAGNESPQHAAQIPALWPRVIGVGASNLPLPGELPSHSCYSNRGDVYAPGGDGDQACTPQLSQCAIQPISECGYGLISLVTSQTSAGGAASGRATPYEYAHWVGTSFSTPLVSGLVAYYLEDGTNPHNMASFLDTARQVGGQPGVVTIPTATPSP